MKKIWHGRQPSRKKILNFFLCCPSSRRLKSCGLAARIAGFPTNQIVDLPPGEVFVHRNIANVVVHTDLNGLSVIQYAVDVLKVKHIIVCGHYGCGGVKAALDDKSYGLIDNWLRHIEDVGRLNVEKMKGLEGKEKLDLLCELNVTEQVINVCNTSIVENAWKRGDPLSVHG